VREWVEGSDYARGLGVRLEELTDDVVRLRLPFSHSNSNPGKALHGGCAASLGLIGGQVLARHTLGPETGPFVTAAAHVSYLAAAIGEDVVAISRLARKGKELCFAETTVETLEGKPISEVATVVVGRSGASSPALPAAGGDGGEADPGPIGPGVESLPFIAARQLQVEHMHDGRSRLVMPLGEANGGDPGTFHEGAVLALLDTTGAMAAWSVTGPGPFKASTAALQAQVLGPVEANRLVGYGRVVSRDGDLFWSDVEVANRAGHLQARGTVIYRIVT
jgi:uncharacterized protein (TIGR00369 family)